MFLFFISLLHGNVFTDEKTLIRYDMLIISIFMKVTQSTFSFTISQKTALHMHSNKQEQNSWLACGLI